MFFFAVLLLFSLAAALSPMTLFQAPGFALLLFLLTAPLAHLLQLRLGPRHRSVVIRALPLDPAMDFPRESKQGLGVCCLLLALYLGAVLAAVGGAIPAYPVALLHQNRLWMMLVFGAVYLLFSRGRVSLPADLLFTGLFLALYKANETLGSVSLREAFAPALARGVLGCLAAAAVCFFLLELSQRLRQRNRVAAFK